VLGYRLDEVRGQHHSMFVDPSERNSESYRQFWTRLAKGEFCSGQYHRVGKTGRMSGSNGSYNPIFDLDGKPVKVVKFATDVTEQIPPAEKARGNLRPGGRATWRHDRIGVLRVA